LIIIHHLETGYAFKNIPVVKSCESVNEFRVVEYLLDNGPSTRGEIVKGTDVKWTTAYDCLVRMHIMKLVKRKIVRAGQGRPKVFWELVD